MKTPTDEKDIKKRKEKNRRLAIEREMKVLEFSPREEEDLKTLEIFFMILSMRERKRMEGDFMPFLTHKKELSSLGMKKTICCWPMCIT